MHDDIMKVLGWYNDFDLEVKEDQISEYEIFQGHLKIQVQGYLWDSVELAQSKRDADQLVPLLE